MRLTVIGAGYVGLVTAACFAEIGHKVLCVEKEIDKLEKLTKGIPPFFEPGLKDIVKRNLKNTRLQFTDSMEKGVGFSDVIFLCVGTPQGEDGRADLSQIEYASRSIAKYINSYKLIVEKSTVPVNTHKWIKKTIDRFVKKHAPKIEVASNPEFLREGSAVKDFMNPDRIVIGVETNVGKELFKTIYADFIDKGFPVLFTTPSSAELIKHASNSFLALKISYINMVADLCEVTGADIGEVAIGIGYDKRIGKDFLNAGIGYGGSCFPKDIRAFVKIAERKGVNFDLLREVERINTCRKERFVERVEDILWISKDKNIAIWGLSFKPDTDDIREAPSLYIVKRLYEMGAKLFLYDPKAMGNFSNYFPEESSIKYGNDKYEVLRDVDALIILTDWEEFRDVDFKLIKQYMRLPIIIDGRNIFDPKKLFDYGFEYYSFGRGNVKKEEEL